MSSHRTPTRLRALALASLFGLAVFATLKPGTAEAALVARDLTGDNVADAYYDTTLDITWYASANKTLNSQADARAWAQGLTVGAATHWRLPNILPVSGGPGYDLIHTNNGSSDRGTAVTGIGWGTASEMGHLFYVTLQNLGYWTVDNANPNSTAVNPLWDPQAHDTGPLDWEAGDVAYFAEQIAGSSANPWAFSFRFGFQHVLNEGALVGYALAVHDGDVGTLVSGGGGGGNTVPVPGSLLLLAAGLLAAVPALRRAAPAARP